MSYPRDENGSTSTGTLVSLPTGLTLLFAAAKLFGFINWSWWIVFLPVMISFGLGFLFILVVLLVMAAGR